MTENQIADSKTLPRIQSLGRGFEVLFCIARSERGLQAKEVIQEAGLDRQTVYHILQSLNAIGIVTKTTSNRYVVGLRAAELVEAFHRHLGPAERLAPLVRAVAQETGETAYAVGWVDNEIIALTAARGTKTITAAEVPRGYGSNAHARASGKLLLALADPSHSSGYLDSHELTKLTPNTLTDRKALEREFENIRKVRHSIEREEFASGLCCLAVPVGKAGSTYALAISVPEERFEASREVYLTAMRSIADHGLVPQE
jgi:DNA-binding IclR family transcriptional regulator